MFILIDDPAHKKRIFSLNLAQIYINLQTLVLLFNLFFLFLLEKLLWFQFLLKLTNLLSMILNASLLFDDIDLNIRKILKGDYGIDAFFLAPIDFILQLNAL